MDWFLGQIGDEPIGSIDKAAALELRADLVDGGRSHARADRMMANVRAILNLARTNGHLTETPVIPMFNDADDGEEEDFRWLTRYEFAALARQLPKHLELAARFAVLTGLRMRSMLRLTWDRVDMDGRRLRIPRMHMKGRKGARKALGLPITDQLLEVLKELRAHGPNGAAVFQYDGAAYDDCNTQAFKKAIKRAGIADLRWHDLRHTFASWAIQNGVSLSELMELGGWKSYKMVQRYAHLAPDHLAQAAARVAQNVHTAPAAVAPAGA